MAQASVAYDHRSGTYAGVFVSNVRLGHDRRNGAQVLGYAGYSARLPSGGLSWDAGAAYSGFSGSDGYGYAEYHVGLAHANWSARLSYAPRYFGQDYSAAYAELNLTPGSERALAPLLHVGAQRWSASPYLEADHAWDARIGISYSHDLLTAQLSWGTASKSRAVAGGGRDRSGWVLRLTRWI